MRIKYVNIFNPYAKPLRVKYLSKYYDRVTLLIDMSYINKTPFIFVLFLAVTLTTACESWLPNAHRPDFTQGNVIKPDALEQIKVGMTKSDIVPILGTPMLKDPFHANRWDYVYRYLPRGRTQEKSIESRVTLFFEDDVLIKIDDSLYVEPRSDDVEKKDN